MGCDIHGWIEANDYKERFDRCVETMKLVLDNPRKPKGENPEEFAKRQVKVEWNEKINIRKIISRNYDFFSVVFGVRRERPEEHYGISAIAPNRGIPEDASHTIKQEYKECEGDYHSASYITLKEFKEIPWDKCQGKIAEFCMMFGEDKLQPLMEALSDGTDKNVRMVVWFDN